jgi:hypothetical protein
MPLWRERMADSKKSQAVSVPKGLPLKKLTAEQVAQIDELLSSLGDYGEIHLIVKHGELKYVNRVESNKA